MSNDFTKQELSTKVCIYFGFSLIYGLHCYSSAWIQGYSALWFLRYLFLCFILRGASLITAGGQLLKPHIHLHIFLFSVYVFLSTHTHTHTNASVVLTGASFHCEVSRHKSRKRTHSEMVITHFWHVTILFRLSLVGQLWSFQYCKYEM